MLCSSSNLYGVPMVFLRVWGDFSPLALSPYSVVALIMSLISLIAWALTVDHAVSSPYP